MAEKKKIQKRTGGRKKTSARRSSSPTVGNPMPRWIYVTIITLATTIALYLIYTLFFRPYFYRFRPCYGHKHYEICLPSGYTVFGIDISRHQGNIDWEAFRNGNPAEAPISFVYIKATEGSDFTDTNFADNFEEAGKYGFLRGAYHYFSTTSSGTAQAQMFIKTAKLSKGDLPPMVDIEERPKNKAKFLQELKIFITKLEEHYGVKPLIYTYRKYKSRYLNDPFFDRYPSWIAHYYIDALDNDVKWLIWQCSDIGEVPGIPHNVDINIFNGSLEQLKSMRIK
ncbi:MAG: glycoside hydrolase family 25 protein [Bacteroidaceae bacterium]|nr:glycoside hydrolase family 25 protein [Bacteroidaceae bacterium]